jgi:hypothetical protein
MPAVGQTQATVCRLAWAGASAALGRASAALGGVGHMHAARGCPAYLRGMKPGIHAQHEARHTCAV